MDEHYTPTTEITISKSYEQRVFERTVNNIRGSHLTASQNLTIYQDIVEDGLRFGKMSIVATWSAKYCVCELLLNEEAERFTDEAGDD